MYKVLRLSLNMVLTMAMVLAALIPGVTVSADANVGVTAIGEVTDPGILPDSGFYFVKGWGRNLELMFAAGDAEKASLMLKYSNEDALALKKLCDMGKCDIAAQHAGQYSLQLQNAIQTMEYVRLRQGASVSAALAAELERDYLQQQEVLLSVVEKAPEAAQTGLLNAIENSSKNVGATILAHQGQAALEQYQIQVNQQTNNMGESTKIKVQQTGLQLQVIQQTGLQVPITQNQGDGQSDENPDENTQGNGNNQQGQ
jgi:hypothetical protein